jgi:hypothetical protein
MPVTDREARLEARVRELESERGLRGRGRRVGRAYDEAREDYVNLGERKIDEFARLFSGTVRASLEGLRVAAESASYFVDDVLERSIPDRDEAPTDVVRRLPSDLRSGFSRKIDRSLDAPGRKVERFQRSYTVDEGGRPRRRRRGAGRGPGGRREPATEDVRRWSRQELYDRAADLAIEDFHAMDREQLAEAIEAQQRRYEDWTTAELYRRARDLDIDDREDMDRAELISELRRRERRAAPARPQVERVRRQQEDEEQGDELERMSRSDLAERAQALGIDPGSRSAAQLRTAIRNHKPTLEDMSREELYELARRYDISNRSQMNREELVEAVRKHEEEQQEPKAS